MSSDKAEPTAQPGTKAVAGTKEATKKTTKAVSTYEKSKRQKEPSKKELLKDLERELGHKPDSKYDKMSSIELQKALGKVKESKSAPATAESIAPAPGKQQVPAASSQESNGAKGKVASGGGEQKHETQKAQDKLADMSRKELRDALARESGEKLGDRYNRMSKNELKKELEGLRAKKISPPPSVKNETQAGIGTPASATSTAGEDKYKRDPKLANVKWSDNELRKHIKDNLDTLGDKYDKNKYEKMSRQDLEQAYSKIHSQAEKHEKKDKSDKDKSGAGDKYEKLSRNELEKAIEKELGHKLDKKYDNMSKKELRNELASLKEKDKKSSKSDAGDKYENMSRKELTDAITKEKGEPLNDHYKRMSKNELANELASLKEKGGNKKANSNNPESWSKDQLKDHIKQLTDALGEKYKKNYDKQSQRELVNSYKALAAEKAQKDALAKRQPGAEHNSSTGSQPHPIQDVSYSSGGGGLNSFRGVLANQSADQRNSLLQGNNNSGLDYGIYGSAKGGPINVSGEHSLLTNQNSASIQGQFGPFQASYSNKGDICLGLGGTLGVGHVLDGSVAFCNGDTIKGNLGGGYGLGASNALAATGGLWGSATLNQGPSEKIQNLGLPTRTYQPYSNFKKME